MLSFHFYIQENQQYFTVTKAESAAIYIVQIFLPVMAHCYAFFSSGYPFHRRVHKSSNYRINVLMCLRCRWVAVDHEVGSSWPSRLVVSAAASPRRRGPSARSRNAAECASPTSIPASVSRIWAPSLCVERPDYGLWDSASPRFVDQRSIKIA